MVFFNHEINANHFVHFQVTHNICRKIVECATIYIQFSIDYNRGINTGYCCRSQQCLRHTSPEKNGFIRSRIIGGYNVHGYPCICQVNMMYTTQFFNGKTDHPFYIHSFNQRNKRYKTQVRRRLVLGGFAYGLFNFIDGSVKCKTGCHHRSYTCTPEVVDGNPIFSHCPHHSDVSKPFGSTARQYEACGSAG